VGLTLGEEDLSWDRIQNRQSPVQQAEAGRTKRRRIEGQGVPGGEYEKDKYLIYDGGGELLVANNDKRTVKTCQKPGSRKNWRS